MSVGATGLFHPQILRRSQIFLIITTVIYTIFIYIYTYLIRTTVTMRLGRIKGHNGS